MDLINYFEAIPGVEPIPDDLNPATWMLEVTTSGNEERLGVDFAAVFDQSSLCRCARQCHSCFDYFADALLMLVAAAAAAACAIPKNLYCYMVHAGECVLRIFYPDWIAQCNELDWNHLGSPSCNRNSDDASYDVACYGQRLLYMCWPAAQCCWPSQHLLLM